MPAKTHIAGLICVVMVVGMLGVGLTPFKRPPNRLTWLRNQDGVRFGAQATLLSHAPFPAAAGKLAGESACSIEVFLQSVFVDEGPTILAFSTADNPLQLTLRQFRSTAIVDKASPAGRHRTERIGTPNVFTPNRPLLLTITSGTKGSAIFVDGQLRGVFPEFHFGGDCRGRLVMGTSPVAYNKWPGRIFRLAVFSREISASEAARDYQAWIDRRPPEIPTETGLVALYLFNERGGAVVHNAVPGGVDLYIPDRFVLLHQLRLEPFWNEYRPTWSHWKDIFVNVVGFMPLGVFCYASSISLWGIKRPVLKTVILGFAVSLTIEIFQSYVPTRNSGTMDLITNTVGTYLGVGLFGGRAAQALRAMVFGKTIDAQLADVKAD